MNTNHIAAHVTALGLAALVTLSALAGMNKLATQSYDTALAASAPVQQIVIVGQRATRA